MSYPIPKWMDKQPVTIYYNEDQQENNFKKGAYICRSHCGICYRSLIERRKKRGMGIKKIESRELKTRGVLQVGKEQSLFWLHMVVCSHCHLKYKLKSSEENLNIERKYLGEE